MVSAVRVLGGGKFLVEVEVSEPVRLSEPIDLGRGNTYRKRIPSEIPDLKGKEVHLLPAVEPAHAPGDPIVLPPASPTEATPPAGESAPAEVSTPAASPATEPLTGGS